MPYGPLDIGGAIAFANNIMPDFADQELRRRAVRVQEGQLAQSQAEHARLEGRRAKYQAGFEGLIKGGGGAQAYSQFALEFPEFQKEVKESWEMQDNAQKQSALTRLSSLHEALKAGNVALAKKAIDAEIAADIKFKGHADDEDLDIQAKLASGNPDEVAQAKGLAGAVLYSILPPDKFASIVEEERKAELDKGKPIVMGPGTQLRNPQTGELLASAPFAPKVNVVGEGGTLVRTDLGGGSGGGGGVQRSGGLTPRASSGGDNSDKAVDNKLGLISQRTGFDVDNDLIEPQHIPALAEAYIQSEGGDKSRGARVNNPGNILDGEFAKAQPGYAGSDGKFAKFDSPGAGRMAVTKLIQNKLNKGYRTVRDIIEGVPQGGGQAAASGGGDGGGGSTVLMKGKPKVSATRVVNGKTYYKIGPDWFDNAEGT